MTSTSKGGALLFAMALLAFDASAEATWGTGVFRGRAVDFRVVEGYAVVEGDILIGRASDLAGTSPQPRAFTDDNPALLWPKGPSGNVEVPYTVEADPNGFVPQAIASFNAVFTGLIQFVPRTTQADYVAFALNLPATAPACLSSLGRVGGKQMLTGPPQCTPIALLHEMGHAIGLQHEQQRNDRDLYISWFADNTPKLERSQTVFKAFNRQIAGPYDYGSIMHYDDFAFSGNGRPTLVTNPQGIEIGFPVTYSAADIDTVKRLYGVMPTRTIVTSQPPGMTVMVDGQAVVTPKTYDWPLDSVHTIDVPQPGQSVSTVPYFFGRWNVDVAGDGIARRTIAVVPGLGTPTNPATAPAVTVYTAFFVRLLPFVKTTDGDTAAAKAAITASVDPAPQEYPGLAGTFMRANQPFTLMASVLPGFNFGGWFYDGLRFEREGPLSSVWRGYALGTSAITTVTAVARAAPILRIKGRGSDGVVDGFTITIDGTPKTTPYSSIFSVFTGGGAHQIGAVASQVQSGATRRYLFTDWDGASANPISVTVPTGAQPSRDITANFKAQYLVTARSRTSCAGTVTVSPTSPDGFYDFGSQIAITAAPSAGFTFAGWKDDFGGTATTVVTTVTGEVFGTAYFNTAAVPVTVTGTSRLYAVVGEPAFELTVYGTGFTQASRVFVNNVSRTTTFVDENRLKVTIQPSDLTGRGEVNLIAANTAGSGCIVSDVTFLAVRTAGYATPAAIDVVEFYNATLDHYFITASPDEMAKLDNGTFKGWSRTGGKFRAFPADSSAVALDLAKAVCRYYGNPAAGLDSHFYSGDKDECDAVKRKFPTAWVFESGVVFQAVAPDHATGSCPDGTTVVYRLFNQRADANHRYTTDPAVRAQMIAKGYVPEGYGSEGVALCSENF